MPVYSSATANCRRRGAGFRGFVLVMVLWLIALLTIIALGLAYNSRQAVRGAGSITGGVQARYLAEGGIQLALMNLLSRQPQDRLLGDGETIELSLPGGVVALTVTDEAGKIDLNTASAEMMSRLFASFDVPPSDADALADALVDFRDEDDLKGLNGAEDPDYEAAGLPWGAKDSAFSDVEELQRVYGMPRWLYQAALPYVTIHSRARGVNPEVAPLQVLFALSDESPGSLENYIRDRRDNHLARLPLPSPPAMDSAFVTRARGVTLTISAVGKTGADKQSAIATVVRIRRGRNRETVETLDWSPYRRQAVEGRLEHGSLGGVGQGAGKGPEK